MDEFFQDFESFKPETKEEVHKFISDKETVWIAMSNIYFGTPHSTKPPADADLEVHIKNQFPNGFQVAKMNKPLRSPLSITKEIKKGVARRDASQLGINDR